MSKIQHREFMWAEMKPDMYGGEMCNQLVPGWHCYCDGDKDAEDGYAWVRWEDDTGDKLISIDAIEVDQ